MAAVILFLVAVLVLYALSSGTSTEQRTPESEHKYRVLFDNLTTGIALCGVLHNGHRNPVDYRFLEVNPAFTKLTGLQSSAVIGKTVREVLPVAELHWVGILDRVILTGQAVAMMNHSHTLNRFIDARVCCLGRDRCAVMLDDITDRVQAESTLLRLMQEFEDQKRSFYRQTILCITDGKLELCDEAEVLKYVAGADIRMAVNSAPDVGVARRRMESFACEIGLPGQQLNDFGFAVGEGLANAVKHGGGCQVYLGTGDKCIWVAIVDRGPGIASFVLPYAILQCGFSTKSSLGLGYKVMLETADHILLDTGTKGTGLVLIKQLAEASAVSPLSSMPDTW